MKQDGYTLAEVLAAMLILGLAMGGLVEGTRVIGRLQKSSTAVVSETRTLRRAEAAFAGLLALRSGDDLSLKGDSAGFAFDCSSGPCSVALRTSGQRTTLAIRRGEVAQTFLLPQAGNIALVYDALDGRHDRWPSPDEPRALRGVAVMATSAQGEFPIVAARSWIEHPKTCEFDMIARGCRTSGP